MEMEEQEEELLNPERELTMEDLRRFRAECCLEYVVMQFREKRSWRPGPKDWVRLYWAIDLVHANFTKRLQERVYLTDKELKIACLTKVKVQPTVIAWLFSCSLTDEGPADGDRLALLLFANRYLDDPQAAV